MEKESGNEFFKQERHLTVHAFDGPVEINLCEKHFSFHNLSVIFHEPSKQPNFCNYF
jgi:hypothetical protein